MRHLIRSDLTSRGLSSRSTPMAHRLLFASTMRPLLLAAFVCGGCVGTSVIPLLGDGVVPVTVTPAHSVPLEVITRKSAIVKDPLPVRGGWVAFEDVEAALGHAVSSAAVPWAEKHMEERPAGWQLDVELISADAETRGREVLVTLGVRATLRTRTGNRYLAQTQTHCSRSAVVEPRDASPVVFDCMSRIGRVLGGWLGGVQP